MRAHRGAAGLVREEYWRHAHTEFPALWGIPESIPYLIDSIFFGLSADEVATTWLVRLLSAIPVGADLSTVSTRFLVWLLSDLNHGTRRLCNEHGQAATDGVMALLERRLAGDEPATWEWSAAWKAALRVALRADAPGEAGVAAARATAAESGARAASHAAEEGPVDAAFASGRAAEAEAAHRWPICAGPSWEAQADRLVHLCKTAPVAVSVSTPRWPRAGTSAESLQG